MTDGSNGTTKNTEQPTGLPLIWRTQIQLIVTLSDSSLCVLQIPSNGFIRLSSHGSPRSHLRGTPAPPPPPASGFLIRRLEKNFRPNKRARSEVVPISLVKFEVPFKGRFTQ